MQKKITFSQVCSLNKLLSVASIVKYMSSSMFIIVQSFLMFHSLCIQNVLAGYGCAKCAHMPLHA